MEEQLQQISGMARRAVQQRDWPTVKRGAQHLLTLAPDNPEGHFLQGLFEKADSNPAAATACFESALQLDAERYDAAIELAYQYLESARSPEALQLLEQYEDRLSNSPRYLDLAGTIYSTLELNEKAWPLFRQANELQPDIDLFKANLAACAVHLGNIDEAETIFNDLLSRHPDHQRNHYHLSRLRTASDDQHVNAMLKVLEQSSLPHAQNIFLYYALGKELEDLERWDEAFHYYRLGADAVHEVSGYDVQLDIDIIDTIADTCNKSWLHSEPVKTSSDVQPIFVFGLPRTGSTLTERIISSHSEVKSIGETLHFENLLRAGSGINDRRRMTPEIIRAAAKIDPRQLADGYIKSVSYQLDSEPRFLEKLPYNFLYAGFIAKAFPDARMVYVKRHPLDACFAMYKQVFTWAYQFSYNLKDLGNYYIAHRRLLDHWLDVLGDQVILIEYEALVADQETETRRLLDRLGLPFEAQCLEFHSNQAASSTASSVQVRQPIYKGSVAKWTRFSEQLAPLRELLVSAGIEC